MDFSPPAIVRFSLYGVCAIVLFGSCAKKKENIEAVKTVYMHPYGVEIQDKDDWLERGGSGHIVASNKDGTVAYQEYQNGKPHGMTKKTFPHTDVTAYAAYYDNGTLAYEIDHYVSGTPKQKREFLSEDKIVATSWYEDGTPRLKEEYIDGLLLQGRYFTADAYPESEVVDGLGLRTIRDGLGNLVAKETVTEGEVILAECYHPNGSPSERTPYVNGKVHGIKKCYHIGGEPDRFEEWQEGKLDGVMVVFTNGEKISEVPYAEGERQGIERRFRSGTGMVVEQISWDRDRRHGPTITNIDGNDVTEWYFEGRKVSKPQYLDLTGRSMPSDR